MSSSYPVAAARPGAFNFMGMPVHRVAVDDVHVFINEVISKKAKALVLNLNIHCVNLALQNSWLRYFFHQAQLVFCDGDGVRWGIKMLGQNPPPKITYDRWFWQLSGFCDQRGYSLYLLGSKPGVTEEAARKLQAKFPALKIVGFHHGYFAKAGEENERVIEDINKKKPDILAVGFGMPIQEKWLSENWRRIDAHIFLDGGAVFDYVSGRVSRAPAWMLKNHLEWLYRLYQEPRRLFIRYVLGIPYFFFHVLLEKLKGGSAK